MHAGSCLCGTVRFEAGPFEDMEHCHCSMCRKHHGSMFATFLEAPADGFHYVSGEEAVITYASSERGRRPFCRHCGSVLPVLLPHLGRSFIPAGNVEGDPGIRPGFHIFAASCTDWFPITDSLKRYERFSPAHDDGSYFERAVAVGREGIIRGSCLCGDVAFELSGPPDVMQNCHCSRCRRARSAAHATNAMFRGEQLRWVRGEDRIERFPLPGAKRFGQDFCRRCGSPVARVVPSTGYVVVPCGSLDDPPGSTPRGHIFVADKAPWYEITDGKPQWEELPA